MAWTLETATETLKSEGFKFSASIKWKPTEREAENAGYDWLTNTIQITKNSPIETLWHEGSHAEHAERLGIAGSDINKLSLEQIFGILLCSESYVGHRLHKQKKFISFERERLSAVPTVTEWKKGTIIDLEAAHGSTFSHWLSFSTLKYIMIFLPSVTIEKLNDDLVFLSDLESHHPFPIPLKILNQVADFGMSMENLENLDSCSDTGKEVIELFRTVNIHFVK